MSAMPNRNAHTEPDKQLKNFLTLKAKVIHTDELIRRYREKGQECASLQEQLRKALSQEASLQQSLVGLRAEVSALLREKESLQDVVTASQWEKELAEARATNAELVVQQLTAQVDSQREAEASLKEERDKLAEQCTQLQEQLRKVITATDRGSSLGISPVLQFLLSGRRRRHHSFSSSFSLPTSPPLSSESPTPFSLPSGTPRPRQEGSEINMDVRSEVTEEGGTAVEEVCVNSETLPVRGSTPTDLDLSLSDSSSSGVEMAGASEGDDGHSELDFVSSPASERHISPPLFSSSNPLPSPLVHAAADTMNSDSDSELSLSEVESLSPIPPSPQPRLPTLSPLPLSPPAETLSPLPSSPPPSSSPGSTPLPQFVCSAPISCLVPVPSLFVTSSPPPIVTPSHLHQGTLHSSRLSPFSAARLPTSAPVLIQPSPNPPAHSTSPFSSEHQTSTPELAASVQQPLSIHQPSCSSCNARELAVVQEKVEEETACREAYKEDQNLVDGEHKMPVADENEENSANNETKQVEESFCGSARIDSVEDCSLHDNKVIERRVDIEDQNLLEKESGCRSEDKEEHRSEAVQSLVEDVSREMKVSLEDVQCTEESNAETVVAQRALEDGEISEDEEESGVAEEAVVVLESGVMGETENSYVSAVVTPVPHLHTSRPQTLTPSPLLSGTSSQKRRPSDSLVAPQPKATRLTPNEKENVEQVSAAREGEEGVESSSVAENSTSSVIIESVEAHSSKQQATPTGVGYSPHPTTLRRMGHCMRPSSGDGASHLQTDGATGQVEEQAPPQSQSTESLASGSPSQPPDPTLAPSLLQQSLCADLCCPLALPDWLVTAMLRVQSNTTHNPQPFRKKKFFHGGRRQPKQKAHPYVGNVLERLVTGQMPLSTAVKLLADSWNCSNTPVLIRCLVNYLQTCYKPRIEHVMAIYNTLCSDARSKVLECPASPSFPPALLRPECQLLALLYHTSKLNSSTSQLLPEVASALYSAALSPLANFHKMAAITRLFTAVCRLLGQRERVLFLSCDLLRKPLSCQELPVVTGMIGVWPAVFARRPDMELVMGGRMNPAAVEAQPLSYAVEVVVTAMMKQGGLSQHHVTKLHTLCQWSTGQTITVKTVDKLASVLLQLLQTSRRVTVEQEPCQGWFRPRPSHLTFQLVHTLRLLSWFKGWVWTSDVLIKAHVWPILQAWNSKKDSVPEATVMAVVRLLGFIGQPGAGSGGTSLMQLQKVLLSLLIREETPLSVQLCAAESLIDLCPPSLPSSQEAVAVLWQWLRGLASHPAGPHLSREFCPKLCTAPHQMVSSHSSQNLPGPSPSKYVENNSKF